ncbi:MAG: M23 family metallopeptidase [Acidobacteriaceae bacterium]|nr:M23 family metallopeptidase [Acidobacteriaceae bacterium]MBV9780892.1 M23 family metallopeptidase [Acidobacteriaceae bacterium]
MHHLKAILLSVALLAVRAPSPALLFAAGCHAAQDKTQIHVPIPQPMSSPFVIHLLSPIHPVAGIDGMIHLSYAVQVTNTTFNSGKEFKAIPVDPLNNFEETGHNFVETDDGKDITGLIRRFSVNPNAGAGGALAPEDVAAETDTPQYLNALGPGQSGVMFFDVTYPDPTQVPLFFSHHLFVEVADLGQNTHNAFTIPVPVSCEKAVTLRPPLAGAGWFDANGCCAIVNGHRSAVIHLNGDLWVPEQFAIDWLRLDAEGRCCNGDPADLKSWQYYGVPIYAAASGTVAKVLARDLPNQKPLHPEPPTLDTLAGNGIIENIGDGRFIMYAHLAPGSIPANIIEGTHVEAGQVIGKLGNSGNSAAPHLHFQVMDRPSALVSHGLPFVFDHLKVEGHVIGKEGPVVDDFLAGKAVRLNTSNAGPQSEKMPLSSNVYRFQ